MSKNRVKMFVALIVAMLVVIIHTMLLADERVKCADCKGTGVRTVWQTCDKCNGTQHVRNVRTTKYRDRSEGTNVRRFKDGNAGYTVGPCPKCVYGLGNKRNGTVRLEKRCGRCQGEGYVTVSSVLSNPNESSSVNKRADDLACRETTKKTSAKKIDLDLELARANINTNAFTSHKCKYRFKCEHCNALFKKNQLTKSYCDRCYVCEGEREKQRKADEEQARLDAELKKLLNR